MTIEEAYTSYQLYAKAERQYAPETLIKIRDAFNSWIQPTFRGRAVEELNRFDVLLFRNSLIEAKLSVARQLQPFDDPAALPEVLPGCAPSRLR